MPHQQLLLRIRKQTASRLRELHSVSPKGNMRMCCIVVGQITDRRKSTLIYGLTFQGEASDQRGDISIER